MAQNLRIPELPPIAQFKAGQKFSVYDPDTGLTHNIDAELVGAGSSVNIEWRPDVEYANLQIVTYNGDIWQSLQPANQNNIPTEGVWWTELTKGSAGITLWTSGVYLDDEVYKWHNEKIYALVDPTRPYNSTDIDAEIIAGDWVEWSGQSSSWQLDGNSLSAIKKLGTISNHPLPIITNNVERARFTTTGQFLHGVTSGLAKHHLKTDSNGNNWAYIAQNSDDYGLFRFKENFEVHIGYDSATTLGRFIYSGAAGTLSIIPAFDGGNIIDVGQNGMNYSSNLIRYIGGSDYTTGIGINIQRTYTNLGSQPTLYNIYQKNVYPSRDWDTLAGAYMQTVYTETESHNIPLYGYISKTKLTKNNPSQQQYAFWGDVDITGTGIGYSFYGNRGGVRVSNTDAYYFGDADVDGTWLIKRNGNDLIFQRREAGIYVTKNTITP